MRDVERSRKRASQFRYVHADFAVGTALGLPALFALVVVFYLMVAKPT